MEIRHRGKFDSPYTRWRDGMGRMGKVMAIVNQTGGVGKSTTAVNLAAYLAVDGHEVLLIDLDPQGNATSGVGVDKAELQHCMYDVLVQEAAVEDVLRPTELEG